ncbi:MAG: hypothetical protein ACI89J_002165 [Hyphomicrobiaceae bacterium]|jgi:uncharacterized protein
MQKRLSDAEADRLAAILDRFPSESAMNLEGLDGFFAALQCCPELVLPSEYLAEIWGDGMDDAEAISDEKEFKTFVELATRHWNFMPERLKTTYDFMPLLLEDEDGIAHANDWAIGFMQGMNMRRHCWAPLLDDEENGGLIVPIFALAYEHSADPELRSYDEPVSEDRRLDLIVGMAAYTPMIFNYFAPQRRLEARSMKSSATNQRTSPKIGRNDPCPCESGTKYKKCCGRETLH